MNTQAYSSQDGENIKINDAKVIFLGDGDTGKTYTLKRLVNAGQQENEAISGYFRTTMTHGVITKKVDEIMSDGTHISLYCWDFGGQAIMHSLHRLFLTDNTCYVVMVSTRNGREQMSQARYWLRNITTFTKGASVLLMINQWEHTPEMIDTNQLFAEFDILKDTIILNAKKSSPEEFNAKLRDTILRLVQEMGGFDREFPISWYKVQKEIIRSVDDSNRYYLSQNEYIAICQKYQVTGKNKQTALLEYFNNLGICLSYHHQQNEKFLEEYNVLNPEWLLNAMYLIIMQGVKYSFRGILPYSAIKAILRHPEDGENIQLGSLKDIRYTVDEIEYILAIMRKFNLSYQTNEGEFIPALCGGCAKPKDLIPAAWDSSEPRKDHVKYILRYRYKPDTVVQRLMISCKQNNIISEVWWNGLRVTYPEFGLTVIVDAGLNEEDIILDVYSVQNPSGKKYATHLLMQMLLGELEQINHEMNLEPEAYVEIQGEEEINYFAVKQLIHQMKEGRKSIRGLDDNYIVLPILLGIYGPEVLTEAQIRTEDEEYSYELVERLARSYRKVLLENPYTEKTLCNNISIALQKIQANHVLRDKRETDFNTVFQNLIPSVYQKRDQTMVGIGKEGKASGKVDLKLLDNYGQDFAFIESLHLGYVNQKKIYLHLDKALEFYNVLGTSLVFLIFYGKTNYSERLWNDLVDHIKWDYIGSALAAKGSRFTIIEDDSTIEGIKHGSISFENCGKSFTLHVFMLDDNRTDVVSSTKYFHLFDLLNINDFENAVIECRSFEEDEKQRLVEQSPLLKNLMENSLSQTIIYAIHVWLMTAEYTKEWRKLLKNPVEDKTVKKDDIEQTIQNKSNLAHNTAQKKEFKHSQEQGAALENNLLRLLRKLFHWNFEDNPNLDAKSKKILDYLKPKNSGSQNGRDLDLIYLDDTNQKRHCWFECKSYQKTILKQEDILGKILQAQDDAIGRNIEIEHWILFAPNSKLNSDAERLFTKAEQNPGMYYPIKSIQLWSDATQVQELIATVPELYQDIYESKQSSVGESDFDAIITRWKDKLNPVLLLPSGLRNYLMHTNLIMPVLQTDSSLNRKYEAEYQRHVRLRFREKNGKLSREFLEEYLMKWLEDKNDNIRVVLGEYGDGKTFFLYCLCRRLLRDFYKNPQLNYLPIYFSLQSLATEQKPEEVIQTRMMQIGCTYYDFTEVKNNFHLLICLDGFDEISAAIDTKQVIVNLKKLWVNHFFRGIDTTTL